MAVSKTRAKLVDVARQLFAKNGVDNTTMNDIAVASTKGRRTLYTYFKSKEEIYMAVVESELEKLSDELEHVASENIAPDAKILKLIETHLDSIKMIVFRNGTLRASFFRDIWRVERVRRNFNLREIALFKQVLIERVVAFVLNMFFGRCLWSCFAYGTAILFSFWFFAIFGERESSK